MLSCISNASAFRPKPLWGYDATPGLDRRVKAFGYDYNLHLATRAANLPILLEWLDKIYHEFEANKTLEQDDKDRLYRAIEGFRRGMADTEDELDEFMIQWSRAGDHESRIRAVIWSRHEAAFPGKVLEVQERTNQMSRV